MRFLPVLILAAVPIAGAAAQAPAPAGDVARGRALFVRNGCYSCHGYEGQGGSYTGPRLAPNPWPWQAIAAFIRQPPGMKPPFTTVRWAIMPAFTRKMVTDADVQDMRAYLASMPAPAAADRIPTFSRK
ncbi:c-type cytochrome [Tardiphaga sp.]|jgi:mono/diheme cytochrome c family protein|uniref:c-type cytochrome n=1 Tax=Tardiphaga sp. TaxID=1926292 RepID=UPI0037DA1D12